MDMRAVIEWIMATRLSLQLQDWAIWLSPLCEILHFLGLSMLIGAAGFIDLRLLGFMRGVPVAAALEFAPWAMAGFAVNLVTGVLFILIDPSLYLRSATFYAKLAFIVIAVGNVAIFERSALGARARAIAPGGDTTRSMKIVAGTSLASWFLVMYFGRMLPYLGSAY
jgi:hypothetical protein